VPRLRRPVRKTVICDACRLTGGPFAPAEAAHLRSLHDSLHHGVLPKDARPVAPGPFGGP
jgi:hypothetical protein